MKCPYCDSKKELSHQGSADIEDSEEFDIIDFFQCLDCNSAFEGYRYNKKGIEAKSSHLRLIKGN